MEAVISESAGAPAGMGLLERAPGAAWRDGRDQAYSPTVWPVGWAPGGR